jgi:hypothetical protein
MFRLTPSNKDGNSVVSSELETNADDGHRSETGRAPGMKRRAYSGVLPRTSSVRGWRATFMSV